MKTVLDRIIDLDNQEFEILLTHLLIAYGFEVCINKERCIDNGFEADGEMNVSNIAELKIFVKSRQYAKDENIHSAAIRRLRAYIPINGQGVFMTTADYDEWAHEMALEKGFPRINLINGNQLAEMLVEKWDEIPTELKEKLNFEIESCS